MSEIPAKADLADALLLAAAQIEHMRNYGETTLVTDTGDTLDNTTWVGSAPFRQSVRLVRSTLANLFASACATVYTPILFGFLKAAGRADKTVLDADAFRIIRDYMAASTAVTVQNRNITHTTTVSGVVGSGTPTIRNVTVDAYGRAMEAVQPQDMELAASLTGALRSKHEEQFYFRQKSAIDALSYRVSGEDKGVGTFQTPYDLRNRDFGVLSNMSFDKLVTSTTVDDTAIGGTTVGTSIGRWEVVTAPSTDTTVRFGSGDEFGYRQSVKERKADSDNRACWELKDDCRYKQSLPPLVRDTCYDAGIWVRRKNSATGTFTLYVGGVTVSVDISTLTNDTWTLVGLPQNENNWELAIGTGDTLEFGVSSLAVGTLKVDATFFRQMTAFNGTMWGAEPSPTDMTSNFEGTLNATFPDQGLIQQHIMYGFRPTVGVNAFLLSASSPTLDESGI